MATADSNARLLRTAWRKLIAQGKWAHEVTNTENVRELRQASPLTTIVPEDVRLDILRKVTQWKRHELEHARPKCRFFLRLWSSLGVIK
jgi:hypothetical protein